MTNDDRLHENMKLAINDLNKAANQAIAKYNLTANELIVALVTVASQWKPIIKAPE